MVHIRAYNEVRSGLALSDEEIVYLEGVAQQLVSEAAY